MQHKNKRHGMELKHRTLQPQAHRHLRKRPPLVYPVRHDLHVDQAHRDRRALKVLRLAGRVLGHHGDGDVEAREAREAAENEEGQEQVVDRGAETEGEGSGRGADAEGDL